MDGNVEYLRQKFENMSYNELRKTAKENSLKASGRKTEIIQKLVEKFNQGDVNYNTNNTDASADDIIAFNDQTMEVETENQDLLNNNNDENMDARSDATYTIDTQGRCASVERDFSSINKRSQSMNSIRTTPSKSPGKFKEYFAMKHQEFENQFEDIQTAEERVKSRHKTLTEGVSPRILALAQPKVSKFNEPKDPKTVSFQFGEVAVDNLASVQKSPGRMPFTPPRLYRSRRVMDLQKCAKTLSKERVVSSTGRALLTPRLMELSKPKFAGSSPRSRRSTSVGRTKYTPNLRPYNYVDTTQMTDAEFEEYKRKQESKK